MATRCSRADPSLSRAILIGLTIFWTLRMVMQWGFYSPAIWRGHRFNTAMHYLFSAIWIYVSTGFAVALWMQRSADTFDTRSVRRAPNRNTQRAVSPRRLAA